MDALDVCTCFCYSFVSWQGRGFIPFFWTFDDTSYVYWALPSAVVNTVFKRNLTPICVLSAIAELSRFPKCILTSLLFLPGSLCAATSCGCFSYLYTFLLESDDFSLPRQITQSIPHPDTMSLSAPSNCHASPH